jgi:two-component system, OmpR family, sensor histidine kinase MprB
VTFRTRLTIVAAAAVALAVVVASLVVFLVVRNQLRGQVDDALRNRATDIVQGRGPGEGLHIDPVSGYLEGVPPPSFGGGDFVQLVDAAGHTTRTEFESGALPASKTALDVAKHGRTKGQFDDAQIGGRDYRVYTIAVQDQRGNTHAPSERSTTPSTGSPSC